MRGLTLAAALVVLLAACSDAGGDTTTEPPFSSSGLAGTRWIVDSMTLAGEQVPVVAGSSLTIEFSEDGTGVGGSAGCNSYFGAAAYDAAGSISIGQIGMTEMACMEPGLMEQESRFAAAIASVTDYVLDADELSLTNNRDVVIRAVVRSAVVPTASLDGTRWVADTIIDGQAASSMLPEPTVTLVVDLAASTLAGRSGCNQYGATVAVDDGRMTVTDLEHTEEACEAVDAQRQETLVLGVIADVVSYELDEQRLTLLTADGRGLGFVAQP